MERERDFFECPCSPKPRTFPSAWLWSLYSGGGGQALGNTLNLDSSERKSESRQGHEAPRGDLEGGRSDISIESLGKGEAESPQAHVGELQLFNEPVLGSSWGTVQGQLQGQWPVDSDWLPVAQNLFQSDSTSACTGTGSETEDTGLIHSFLPHTVTGHLPSIKLHARNRKAHKDSPCPLSSDHPVGRWGMYRCLWWKVEF